MAQRAQPRPTTIRHWSSPDDDVPTFVEGDGTRITDDEGTEYLDFISQLYCVNVGHGNERIAEAMAEQAKRLAYVSSSKGNDTRDELAGRLAEVSPGSLSDVFFSVSGSEANEAAVHLARRFTGGGKVLTRWRSYHGSTYGAGSLTGEPETRNALDDSGAATTGAVKFLPPLPEAFDAEGEELAERAANHLEFVIRNEGPDSVAAVLTEPIAGTSGAYTAPEGYFPRVREICDEYDVLLISDEVITGFGRCGEWFGIGTEGVEPDMMTFAKGVTSAYAPLAGVIARPEIGEFAREEGVDLGQTFGGHPVACAAAHAALDEYEDGLIENAAALGPVMEERLADLASTHDVVSEVDGRGLHWGVRFADPDTGEPFVHPWVDDADENPVVEAAKEARERGVLFGAGRPAFQHVLSPPLCVTEAEIDEAVDVLDAAIETAF
jgi:taurine---2-oxoglutarate transaminase